MTDGKYKRAERAVELAASSTQGQPEVLTATRDADQLNRIKKSAAWYALQEAAQLAKNDNNTEMNLAALEDTLDALDALDVATRWIAKVAS